MKYFPETSQRHRSGLQAEPQWKGSGVSFSTIIYVIRLGSFHVLCLSFLLSKRRRLHSIVRKVVAGPATLNAWGVSRAGEAAWCCQGHSHGYPYALTS